MEEFNKAIVPTPAKRKLAAGLYNIENVSTLSTYSKPSTAP